MATLTRGVRNNNPGNIERGQPWQGLAKPVDMTEAQKTEARFDVFRAPEWGIRALARTLITYQDRYSLNTVQGIIGRWAPPGENDTGAYIAAVAGAVGVSSADPIDVHGYRDARSLVAAIIAHENGGFAYPAAVLDKGLLLAGIEPPNKAVVNRSGDKAKTVAAVAGGGAALLGTAVNDLQQVAPAVPIIRDIAALPGWVLATGTAAALAALGVWLLMRRR
jgi:hypothetical protein